MNFLCLVLQNDARLAHATNRGLEPYGLRPYHVHSIKAAMNVIGQWRFDVVLLDADGFGDRVAAMLSMLRETRVPVLVSASAFDEETHVHLLERGATAVVPKLDSMRLTALRLRKLAEISRHEQHELPEVVELGPLVIDTRRAKASVQGNPLDLSSRQLEILQLLATRVGEFVHRHDFASTARRAGDEGSRSVDMHVSRIRSKLKQAGSIGLSIYTVHGLGYCLVYKDEGSTAERATPLEAS